jgi:hypothetical protein
MACVPVVMVPCVVSPKKRIGTISAYCWSLLICLIMHGMNIQQLLTVLGLLDPDGGCNMLL